MDDLGTSSTAGPQKNGSLWWRGALSLLYVLGTMGLLLFGAAGRLDWPAAWFLIGGYGMYLVIFMVWGFERNPDLIRERAHVAENVKGWDKWINAIYTVLLVALLVVCGLDAGRFGWSRITSLVRLAGWLMLLGAGGLIFWTLVENSYLSRWARIQDDRGQQVISSGPYAKIRHPMYAGIIVLMTAIPLALGSWWGLVPGGMISALFLLRTILEDRMLIHELDGYQQYAQRVRYRLLPWVW
jgi:protein-S-isoprenylcysteine O-methyltransferase Ste14